MYMFHLTFVFNLFKNLTDLFLEQKKKHNSKTQNKCVDVKQ